MSARLRATPWFRSEEEENHARSERRFRVMYPPPPPLVFFWPVVYTNRAVLEFLPPTYIDKLTS